MTATGLFHALTAAGVAVSVGREGLWLTGPVPPALVPACKLLKTGLATLATGREWRGCDGRTGQCMRLDTRVPIPDSVTLLAAEGDPRWDRIKSAARSQLPQSFGPITHKSRR